MRVLQWTAFLQTITPLLIKAGKTLYKRYEGRIDPAKEELTRMIDQWSVYDVGNARIDEELEQLKKQGK